MAGIHGTMKQRTTLRRVALGTMLLLTAGSCATVVPPPAAPVSAPPPLPPQPAPTQPPPAPLAASWDDLPVTEGGWSYDGDRRSVRFVGEDGLERASLTCVAAGRTMRLALPGAEPGALDLLTSAGASRHMLSGGALELPVGDVALDRMAFSRGRFALRTGALLVLPVQAEVGRVIEDCRG